MRSALYISISEGKKQNRL